MGIVALLLLRLILTGIHMEHLLIREHRTPHLRSLTLPMEPLCHILMDRLRLILLELLHRSTGIYIRPLIVLLFRHMGRLLRHRHTVHMHILLAIRSAHGSILRRIVHSHLILAIVMGFRSRILLLHLHLHTLRSSRCQ